MSPSNALLTILGTLNERFKVLEPGAHDRQPSATVDDAEWPSWEWTITDMPMMLYSKSADVYVQFNEDYEDDPDNEPKYTAGLQLAPMDGFNYQDSEEDEGQLYEEIVAPIKYTSDSSEQDWQWYYIGKGYTPEVALQDMVDWLNDFFPVDPPEERGPEGVGLELKRYRHRYVLEYPTGVKLYFSSLQGALMVRDLCLNTSPVPYRIAPFADETGKLPSYEGPFWKDGHDMHHPFSKAKLYLENYVETWQRTEPRYTLTVIGHPVDYRGE